LPLDPAKDVPEGEKLKFNVKEKAKQESVQDKNIGRLLSMIIGQCTEATLEQLKHNKKSQDGLELLSLFK